MHLLASQACYEQQCTLAVCGNFLQNRLLGGIILTRHPSIFQLQLSSCLSYVIYGHSVGNSEVAHEGDSCPLLLDLSSFSFDQPEYVPMKKNF